MQRSASYRECWNCKEEFPESETLEDPRGDPMLMDPDHEGLEHWKVCTAKHTPEEIKKSIFIWKKKNEKKVDVPKEEEKKQLGFGYVPEAKIDNPINQVKFDPNVFINPPPMDPNKLIKNTGLSKEAEDYILKKFDETCNTLIENQAVFAKSIANQLQIINNQIATLASNQRTIMRQVGIPDT